MRSAAQYKNGAGKFLAAQLAFLDELAQDILSADVKQVVQLLAEMSGWRIADQRCGGGQQGAGGREPHGAERPQPVLVEGDEFLKGVVAAPMGVAGAVREFLELAKRGASGARTERRHYLGQRGDGLPAKQVAERSGGVLGRSHGGTITSIAIVIVPQRASGTHHTRHEQPSQSIPPANSNGLIASIYRAACKTLRRRCGKERIHGQGGTPAARLWRSRLTRIDRRYDIRVGERTELGRCPG